MMMQRLVIHFTVSLITACAAVAAAASGQSTPAARVSGDPIVAKVNQSEIHRSDVDYAYKNLPAQYGQIPFDTIYPDLLNQLVDRRVVALAADGAGLEKDGEVKARFAFAKERVLGDVYLQRAVGAQITEAQVKAKYDALLKENPPEEEVRARHILVDSEEEAKKIKTELAGGGDFATLANKYSKDAKGGTGGDLGFFTKKRMVPEFADAAFAAKTGEVVGPVKTQFGWHLILVVERRQEPPPPFDQVKEQVRELLMQELVAKKVATLRAGAKIETFAADGTPRKASPPAEPGTGAPK